ncbi:MAG TPA: PQQ-binding-like beta-propeller repeat protein, partial [bacterium]|nr:PQQ-binding-like beta-propeller repeat protein [bacterium]
MTWRKTAATSVLALVVILCLTGCPNKPPATPGAPWGADSTWTYSTYSCSVVTTTSKGFIRYIMDWQDATDTGDVAYASNETAAVTHEWDAAGTYSVKAQAIRDDDPKKASDFSPAKSVKVVLNQRPIVDSVLFPPVAVKGAPTNITVYGHDPDDDSLCAIVKWPKGDTTTELTPTPCTFTVTNIFNDVGNAKVIVWVQDWKKAKSLPDTVQIPVGLEGGVKWWWQDGEEGAFTTSMLVANDGAEEVLLGPSSGDFKFYSLKATNKKIQGSTTTSWPSSEYEFIGDPAFCAATAHVIVGSEEGELYALSLPSLSHAWRWPNVSVESLEPFIPFGAPAISGGDIYVGREVENDSQGRLYKFTDASGSVTKAADYVVGTNEAVVDAPAIDADGSVYCGTDGGYLIKLDANLSSPVWRRHLIPSGEVGGPIIGSDGTVYCGTDTGGGNPPSLYAINPDSTNKWPPLALDGLGSRPALGQSALFIGTDQGTVYSIDPATGSINWQKSLGQGIALNTTPIVAANGYVYIQTDDDVLFCLNQADGTKIWACDCNYYLPGGGLMSNIAYPRKHGLRRYDRGHGLRIADLTGNDPNPSITSTGDIIVVGKTALFCVAGYAAGPLDPNAP